MGSMFHGEEDIKVKLVYPYLKRAGFDENEITFEQGFTLRMGNFTYRVDTEEQRARAQARLDILITRDGKNLCVLEIKSDKKDLDDEDRDQGVSYARLVHPMAPVCIVTNGRQFKPFDTVTKKEFGELEIPEFKSIELSSEQCYDAMKHFIGYSRANLMAFCEWQVRCYTGLLVNAPGESVKKYSADLYVPQSRVDELFHAFIDSGSTAFVILGDSGMGKTCWACHTAFSAIQAQKPIIFYRAVDVSEGIISTLGQDLNWTFSAELSDARASKRFLELFEKDAVLVIVDGIDELGRATASKVVEGFLRRVEGRKIKIILTAKPSALDWLFESEGIPTRLAENSFEMPGGKAFLLTEPTEPEFFEMIRRYRAFYRFTGGFEDRALLDAKRSPFLLRLMFEVAARSGAQHITYSMQGFYEKYYELLLSRFENRESVGAILAKIADMLYERNVEEIDRREVRQHLGIGPLDEIPRRLFDLDILSLGESGGTDTVGFYFGKLRDYVIAFKSLRLHLLTASDLADWRSRQDISGIRLEALNLYYVLAGAEHKRVLDSPLFDNALEFVQEYEQILESNFPNFEGVFPPFASLPEPRREKIGFLGYVSLDSRRVLYHGFRARAEDDEEVVQLFPISLQGDGILFQGDRPSNLAYLFGAPGIRYFGPHHYFRDIDPRPAAWLEISTDLEMVVHEGPLNEEGCVQLLQEKVAAICNAYYKRSLGAGGPFQSLKLPISLEQVEHAVFYERAFRILQDQAVNRKVEAGIIPTRWEGGFVSFSYSLTEEETSEIRAQAFDVARRGVYKETTTKYVDLDVVEASILKAISYLRTLGMSEVTELPAKWFHPDSVDKLDAIAMMRSAAKVATAFLDEYKRLVDVNFPTLINHFRLRSEMPLRCFAVCDMIDPRIPGQPKHFTVTAYFCRDAELKENSVLPCLRDEVVDDGRGKITYNGAEYTWFRSQGLERSIFGEYLPFKVGILACPLRNLIYREIECDLVGALKARVLPS